MEKRFEEILEIVNGRNQKHVENQSGRYPIYGSGGIMGYADDYICVANTVVIGRKGSINKPIFVEEPFWNVDTAFGLVANRSILLPKYLYFFCEYFDFEQLNTTVTIPSLTKANLLKIKIDLPTLEEQKKVVKVLDQINKLISTMKEKIKSYDKLIKSRFVEMFGDPVSNSMDWGTKTMDEVAPIVNYKGGYGDEIWLLNLDMVESQTGRIVEYSYVSEKEIGNSTCRFDETNVLYSKLRPYLNKVVIPNQKGCATSEMLPLQPCPEILNREYLAFMLRSKSFVNMISEKVAGAKMPRVSMSDLNNFKVPLPPMTMQKKFADFVEQIDKLKFALLNTYK